MLPPAIMAAKKCDQPIIHGHAPGVLSSAMLMLHEGRPCEPRSAYADAIACIPYMAARPRGAPAMSPGPIRIAPVLAL